MSEQTAAALRAERARLRAEIGQKDAELDRLRGAQDDFLRCFAEAATDRAAYAAMLTETLRVFAEVVNDPGARPPGADPGGWRRGRMLLRRELQRRRVPS